MPSVYIETTIPSFYFETRTSPQEVAWRETTRRWWDHHRSQYRVVTSEFVVRELELAPVKKRSLAIELLSGVEVLAVPSGLHRVIDAYIRNKLMPADGLGDAAHLGICSMHAIDFLLTWNCRHLANANKFWHLAAINRRLGLAIPTLTTPDLLIPEDV